jgi:GntR family transcriptional regulator
LRQSISFHLSQDSGVPAYLQLAQQVKQAIRMGVLDVGDKLPTVASRPAGPPPATQHRLARSLERWVQAARDAGLDDDGIESLVRATLARSRSEETA